MGAKIQKLGHCRPCHKSVMRMNEQRFSDAVWREDYILMRLKTNHGACFKKKAKMPQNEGTYTERFLFMTALAAAFPTASGELTSLRSILPAIIGVAVSPGLMSVAENGRFFCAASAESVGTY